MKRIVKIMIGIGFLAGGYYFIKRFGEIKPSAVGKIGLDFIPKDTNVYYVLPDGTTHALTLEQQRKGWENLDIKINNAQNNKFGISQLDYEKWLENPANQAKIKNLQVIKDLNKIEPYSIDTTAIDNLKNLETPLNLGFPDPDELQKKIDDLLAKSPQVANWN